ncbi:MAG: bifunctional diaminohydroxyphosphoribosylaminopyrimidine deaminase/5-amino-6-(5-phosphoribosylamino)uracil reductase RibD [Clostridiales bacterium]
MVRSEEKFMLRAISLGEKARGFTEPNPLVGAVIVKNGEIIGEGYHKKAGEPHAEVNALKAAGSNAKGSTIYVTLEPCSHYGKTHPCADALIEARIKEAYIAIRDPNPKVNGGGIAKLEAAGIKVHLGLMGEVAWKQNEIFFTNMLAKRAFVALKTAQSIDGKIGPQDGTPLEITSLEALEYCHRLRQKYNAVLVGINTVLTDNPTLNIRYDIKHPENKPVRIVLDSKLKTPLTANVLNMKYGPAIIYTANEVAKSIRKKYEEKGVTLAILPNNQGMIDLHRLPYDLYKRGICSVMVEGGAKTISGFLQSDIWDIWHSFTAPKIIGTGGISVYADSLNEAYTDMAGASLKRIGEDVLVDYRRKEGVNQCLPALLKKREQ